MSTITDILSAFGVTAGIAESVAAAELNPSSRNVQGVINAYAANGQVIPAKLLAHLIQINEERHPEDTYRGAAAPWLFLGIAAIIGFVFWKRGRK